LGVLPTTLELGRSELIDPLGEFAPMVARSSTYQQLIKWTCRWLITGEE
jgi:hypothetical protein